MANKLYGLVGIYEDYVEKATGPSFEIGCGFGWKEEKRLTKEAILGLAQIVCDPVSLQPAMTCFGAKQLDTSLCHLYTNMAHTLQQLSQGKDVFVMQTEIDIYTEIVMHHNKQKWLEPVIKKHLERYDQLFYVQGKNKEYDLMVRRLMHDFKIKPVQVKDPFEIKTYVQDNG